MLGELTVAGVTLGLCPVGSCPGISVDGEPCDDCLALFAAQPGGWRINRAGAEEPTRPTPRAAAARDQVAADAAARAAKAERERAIEAGREKKPNQLCWLCEERRACTKLPTGWECDTCRTIQ